MVEIDERTMLSDFFDEGKNEEEIVSQEKNLNQNRLGRVGRRRASGSASWT